MDPKKIITVLLAVFVILIWGLAIKRFADSGAGNARSQAPADGKGAGAFSEKLLKKLDILNSKLDFDILPDAFAAGAQARVHPENGQSKTPSLGPDRVAAPPYRLQGIVWDEKEPTAVLIKLYKLDPDDNTQKENSTFIIRPGDRIDYGEALSVTKDYVLIRIRNNKFKLWSNRWEKSE